MDGRFGDPVRGFYGEGLACGVEPAVDAVDVDGLLEQLEEPAPELPDELARSSRPGWGMPPGRRPYAASKAPGRSVRLKTSSDPRRLPLSVPARMLRVTEALVQVFVNDGPCHGQFRQIPVGPNGSTPRMIWLDGPEDLGLPGPLPDSPRHAGHLVLRLVPSRVYVVEPAPDAAPTL